MVYDNIFKKTQKVKNQLDDLILHRCLINLLWYRIRGICVWRKWFQEISYVRSDSFITSWLFVDVIVCWGNSTFTACTFRRWWKQISIFDYIYSAIRHTRSFRKFMINNFRSSVECSSQTVSETIVPRFGKQRWNGKQLKCAARHILQSLVADRLAFECVTEHVN